MHRSEAKWWHRNPFWSRQRPPLIAVLERNLGADAARQVAILDLWRAASTVSKAPQQTAHMPLLSPIGYSVKTRSLSRYPTRFGQLIKLKAPASQSGRYLRGSLYKRG